MVEFHGVDTSTLSHGTEIGDVAEHVRKRDEGSDDLGIGLLDHAIDATTSGRDITHDGTDIVKRSSDIGFDVQG